eukprot:NODE_259_length_11524_cov_0.251028.p3 type:complete len:262 gc:universal NODE_259_length_11524_cov_0.251028:2082-1297(-)
MLHYMGNVYSSTVEYVSEQLEKFFAGFLYLVSVLVKVYFEKMMKDGPTRPTVDTSLFTSNPKPKKHTFDQGKFNFAFIGKIGVGKSSLINGLRGVRDSDPSAASVGNGITASHTTCVTSYEYGNGFIRISDVPGADAGTEVKDYFLMWDLASCDGIIVLVNPQLADFEEELIRFCQQAGFKSKLIIVISKADEFERQGTLTNIQLELKQQLDSIQEEKGMKKYGNIPFYVVSSPNMRIKGSNQYDHVKFFEKIVELGKLRL